MKLMKFYEGTVRSLGFRSWNHYCAEVTSEQKDQLKKRMKRDFKKLKETHRC